MKAAVYIDNGSNQLVLVPESEFESMLLKHFEQKSLLGQMAGVYECKGGYSRFTPPGYTKRDCLVLTIVDPTSGTPEAPATEEK